MVTDCIRNIVPSALNTSKWPLRGDTTVRFSQLLNSTKRDCLITGFRKAIVVVRPELLLDDAALELEDTATLLDDATLELEDTATLLEDATLELEETATLLEDAALELDTAELLLLRVHVDTDTLEFVVKQITPLDSVMW